MVCTYLLQGHAVNSWVPLKCLKELFFSYQKLFSDVAIFFSFNPDDDWKLAQSLYLHYLSFNFWHNLHVDVANVAWRIFQQLFENERTELFKAIGPLLCAVQWYSTVKSIYSFGAKFCSSPLPRAAFDPSEGFVQVKTS